MREQPVEPSTRPFLKWTGGKQWLAGSLSSQILLPGDATYYEPFVGGGAVFFALNPEHAVLSDSNSELIATYRAVRDNVEAVIKGLKKLKNDPAVFKRVRASRPRTVVGRAVRLIYLNKTAFNGIYRVNKRGEFNVPFGSFENPCICPEDRLRAASDRLAGVTLRTRDFVDAIRGAVAGDVVYIDPPYVTRHNNNGFQRYNAHLFSWSDQERLAARAVALRDRGVTVIVSNAAHDSILELYPDFLVQRITRKSLIGGDATLRGEVTEVLLSSGPLAL